MIHLTLQETLRLFHLYPEKSGYCMTGTTELVDSKIVCYMPAFNAASLINDVIRKIRSEHWEIISTLLVINDGSNDNTVQIVHELQKEFPRIKLVSHPENRGYGAAQKTAFDWSRENNADAVVMLHSDGQYPPSLLKDMIQPLFSGVDVVGGSRILHGDMRDGGMSLSRYYGTIALNSIENLVFRQKLSSYHSGYKSYSRNALEKIPYSRYSNTFNFDSEMLVGAIRNRLMIKEVPIPTIHGEGYSSLKPIPYGLSVLHTILKYVLHRI